MQRPSSTISDHSATSSSAGASSTATRTGSSRGLSRPRPVPGGPRRPSAKAALPSPPLQTQQQQEPREQHRQSTSEQPPSYVQSQHDVQGPLQSYTPPPTSAVTSDSSCSHPPMSVFTRADTPSSMSAFSPVRTMSPAVPLEPLEEHSPASGLASAHHSPQQQASLPLPLPPVPRSDAQIRSRTSSPSVPSISKPSTPALPESPASSSAYAKPRTVTTHSLPVPLQPPPSIDFSPVPVAFKALTLDAAQWTFSSAELQAIVSRAIRASAEPSSIRLLPLQTIDEDLVQELERLESERAQATAQYRFTMHRRTMLLQSLNASSGAGPSTSPSSSSFSGNTINLSSAPMLSPAADLAQRLAEVSATLDRLAASLVRISDQLGQIRSLQDVHAASALAVALRKLNASYARRTREVQSLKEKLEATEEERDEAWRVAEELAMEYDGEADEEIDDVVVNGERAVAVPATLTRASRVGMRIKMPGVGPRIRPSQPSEAERENGNGVPEDGAEEAETNANPTDSPNSAPGETADASTTSTPTTARRRRANSATSRVTAARTRSIRASKASLRFPRKPGSASRPTSTYSQHSTQSQSGGAPSRARSRSRANSISSVRDASPTSTSGHGHGAAAVTGGGVIPDVPKIPNATELARLASVKSTASSIVGSTTSTTKPPLPPIPPAPIETSPNKIGSFLDMTTRPNSATDEKGKSPVKERAGTSSSASTAPPPLPPKDESEVGVQDSDAQEDASLSPAGGAQVNEGSAGPSIALAPDGDARLDDDEQWEEVDGSSAKRDADEGDHEAQVVTVSPRLNSQETPLSTSRIESNTSLRPDLTLTNKQQQHTSLRPNLHVHPPAWTRPPPDSPVDVSYRSGPHRADNGDDDLLDDDEEENEFEEDEEERELKDAFESAYAKTELQTATRGRMAYMKMRSPLRVQHAQSMLPFPGTSGAGAGSVLVNGISTVSEAGPCLSTGNEMRKSPASDNQIPHPGAGNGPFRGAALSASTRRPTSLPSAQGEQLRPWDYF